MTEDIPVRIRTTNNTSEDNEPVENNQPIRFRSRLRPTLNFENCHIDERYALPDKLEIIFNNHFARNATEDNRDNFFEAISEPNQPFRRPNLIKTESKIRKRDCPFLYGTSILFYRSEGRNTHQLKINLCLNPTRFLAHSETSEFSQVNFVHLNNNTSEEIKQTTLDNNDNFILQNSSTFADYLNQGNIERVEVSLQCLLRRVTTWLESYLGSHARNEGIDINFDWSNWSISHSEVYFEFATKNSLSLLKKLAPHIPILYPEIKYRHYFDFPEGAEEEYEYIENEHIDITQVSNSFQITIPLGHKQSLVIYPKTINVVRFEIRRRGSLRNLLPVMNPVYSHDIPGGAARRVRDSMARHSIGNNLENIPELLSIFAEHLAAKIHHIIRHINRCEEISVPDLNLIPDLIRTLDQHSPSTEIANEIWSLLSNNGYIQISRINHRYLRTLSRVALISDHIILEDTLINQYKVFRLSSTLLTTLRGLKFDPTFGLLDSAED